MNANHARPLAAFWLLAIVAAAITANGLGADHPAPTARVATPTPVTSTGAPELVLGDVLSTRSGQVLAHPLSPELWAVGASAEASSAVHVSSPGPAGTTGKARTKSGGGQSSTTTQAQPSVTGEATPTSTSTTTSHGKGRGKSDQTATPTTTTTATASPTAPSGKGKGRPVGPGH